MATDTRQRRADQKTPPTGSSRLEKEEEDDDVTCLSVIMGLMPCFAGVGGVSIVLWVIGYFVVPHLLTAENPKGGVSHPTQSQTDSMSLCTEVKDARELIGVLKEIEDWPTLGVELGLAQSLVEGINKDASIEGNELKKRTMLREWVSNGDEQCWETVVKALLKIKNDSLAKRIAEKYKLKT